MPSTLGLYRQLLRVTTIWPSKNRGKIMQEIREGAPSNAQPCVCGTHTPAHHARSGTALRAPSMLGLSRVARLSRSRAEFRQNRAETDATKLQKMFSDASTAPCARRLAAQRRRPIRPRARPACARSGPGWPPASATLGHSAARAALAGHTGLCFPPLDTGLQTMRTQVGWKHSNPIPIPSPSPSPSSSPSPSPDPDPDPKPKPKPDPNDALSGRLEGFARDWQHEWRIVGNQTSCRRLMLCVYER